MANLIPEKRMNKNGVMVVKHVRADVPLTRKPFTIPPVSQFSKEFGTALTSASAVTESLYAFNDDDTMIDVQGNEVHEYGYEEARDALMDLLPHTMLVKLEDKLSGLPEGRLKALIADQVYEDIASRCKDAQKGEEASRMGRIATRTLDDGLELAHFADDFAAPDAELGEITSVMYWASRSVRRNCDTEEWNKLLSNEDAHIKMLESEFIVHLVTNRDITHESDKAPHEIYRRRMEILENYEMVKKHQDYFRERKMVDIAILDQLENTASAVREGVL